MQFILVKVVIEMIETNAKTRRKIEKRRKSMKMKKEISAKVRDFENFDLTCKNLILTQKTFVDLHDKTINFSNKFLLKTIRIDFANMC